MFVCWLVGCLTSQQQASVSRGRICSDNFTCCRTEIEVADPTFHLTQSQYTDTGPTSPSADPIKTPGAWQGSHWSANFEVTGMTRPRKKSRRKRDSNPGSSALEADALLLGQRGGLIEQEPILSCCLPLCATVTGAPYCSLTSDSFITSDHWTVVWSERTVLLNSRAGFVPRRRLKTFGCISCLFVSLVCFFFKQWLPWVQTIVLVQYSMIPAWADDSREVIHSWWYACACWTYSFLSRIKLKTSRLVFQIFQRVNVRQLPLTF